MVERCIDAPEAVRYDIFEAMSDNRWRWRDITQAQRVLGYEPKGSADSTTSPTRAAGARST